LSNLVYGSDLGGVLHLGHIGVVIHPVQGCLQQAFPRQSKAPGQ